MSGRGFCEEEGSTNTGPKGVINDWRKFKLESVDHDTLPPSTRKLLQQMSFAHKPKDDWLSSLHCKMSVQEYELLREDDECSLSQYRERRMREMRERLSVGRSLGRVQELRSGEAFLTLLEEEHWWTAVVVHVYRETVHGCRALNACLDGLAPQYPAVRFCCLEAAVSGASERFSDDVLPALLVYKAGEMLGNLLAVTQHLGEEFLSRDVEALLNEHGLLPEKESGARAHEADED